jgi:hypothetical protein
MKLTITQINSLQRSYAEPLKRDLFGGFRGALRHSSRLRLLPHLSRNTYSRATMTTLRDDTSKGAIQLSWR